MLTKQLFWPHSDCVLYNSSCSYMFLHSSVCVRLRDSGWQTRSPCVADCSVSSKDKQWRVEWVICLLGLNSSPWSPAGLSSLFFFLYAVLLWRWRAFLSVFACIHFSWCGWSCLVNLLKFMSCVHTRGHVHAQSIQIEICKKVTKQNPWVVWKIDW